MVRIAMIAGVAENGVIGSDQTIPWRVPSDMAFFKQATMGKPIIMGRKTWESLGRALPGRPNLVISHNPDYVAEGAQVFTTLDAALDTCHEHEHVCVIGGEQLFRLALPLADEIIATEVHADIDGDTWFPALEPSQWLEARRVAQPAENGLAYDFVTYRRRDGGQASSSS